MERTGDELERDINFYHFVLARELKRVQVDIVSGKLFSTCLIKPEPTRATNLKTGTHRNASRLQRYLLTIIGNSPVQYSWKEWEFFLLLMGNGVYQDEEKFPGQTIEDMLAPAPLQITGSPYEVGGAVDRHNDDPSHDHGEEKPDTDGLVDRDTQRKDKWNTAPHKQGFRKRHTADPLGNWSWLDETSPLMSSKSESWWIVDKLSAALVRELNRSRRGSRRKPPIGMGHIRRGK